MIKTNKQANNNLQVYLLVIGVIFFFLEQIASSVNEMVSASTNSFQHEQAKRPIAKWKKDSKRFLLESLLYFPRELHWAQMCSNVRRSKKFQEQTLPLSPIHCLWQVTEMINHSPYFHSSRAFHIILPNAELEATIFTWPEESFRSQSRGQWQAFGDCEYKTFIHCIFKEFEVQES